MTALKRAKGKAPAAKKGAKAKAPAKAAKAVKVAKLLDGGVRLKGKVNQQHKQSLNAKLKELAPELLDAVNSGQTEKLSIVSSFQRPM
jgi:hypothetical protein